MDRAVGRVLARASLVGLLLAPAVVQAQPAPAAPAVAAAPDLTAVRAEYERGRAKFDTFDYAGAVEVWTQVYAQLGDTPTEREIKNNLVYNIATAQERAYELDHDLGHLRQAAALLDRYVAEYKALHQATPQARADLAAVEAQLAQLEQRIASVDGSAAPAPAPAPEPTVVVVEPPSPRALEKDRRRAMRDLLRYDPELAPEYRSGRGMVIAGAVLAGVGGVMAIAVLPHIIESPRFAGHPGLLVPTAIAAGALLGGGVLLGFGVPKRAQTIDAARARVAWSPFVSPREAGVGLQVQF